MSAMSRSLASMRRIISPISLRRTASPLTSTRVSSIVLSLSYCRLAAALVRGAVGARFPFHVQRPVAVYTGFLQFPRARGAEQVVLLDHVAAVGAEQDAVSELALEHGRLQLALAGVVQVLVGAYYKVDQGSHVGEDDRHEAPQQAHGPAPGGVRECPVDQGQPQYHEQEHHQLAGDPQDGARQKIGDHLERVLQQRERRDHRINLIITTKPRTKDVTATTISSANNCQTPLR